MRLSHGIKADRLQGKLLPRIKRRYVELMACMRKDNGLVAVLRPMNLLLRDDVV
jgi:hypothetical protein